MDDSDLSDSTVDNLQQPYDDLPDYNTDLNASFTEIEQANQDNWAESVAASSMYGNSYVGPGGNSRESAAASSAGGAQSMASSIHAPSLATVSYTHLTLPTKA